MLDKEWLKIEDRRDPVYVQGVDSFLDFAFCSPHGGKTLRCPCCQCRNVDFYTRKEIRFHLLRYGMMSDYLIWHHHGEGEVDDTNDEGDYGITVEGGADCRLQQQQIISDLNKEVEDLKAEGLRREEESKKAYENLRTELLSMLAARNNEPSTSTSLYEDVEDWTCDPMI